MKIEIKKQKSNPLLKRNEVQFEVNHAGESTPNRNAVADEIAKMLKSKRDAVVIDDFKSNYGIGISKGYAKVYENKEAALEFENEHLLLRNGIEKEKPEAPKAEE
ncbi:MAG TPA: 30S ribosomal protein S24e [Candidatus Methanomethylophilaceae archaeon]|nr:30S ribosomal protein S24e [Candidatus Methanomethylophilaceae archaeon]